MRKITTLTLTLGVLICLVSFVWAMEGMEGHSGNMQGQGGHAMQMQESGSMQHGGMQGNMDHSAHMGELIRETTVDGYKMAYHLIDMSKHTMGMKMAATHHLMVYIQSANGKAADQGKVGYLIVNPDGTKQKAMTMSMNGGYGADVNLKAKGDYKVTAKALVNGKKIMDTFEYKVK